MIEQRKINPNKENESYFVWQKRITNIWMSMSDNDKKKYVEESNKQQKQYK